MNNKFTQIVMFFVIFLFFSCASITSNKDKESIPKFSIKPVDIRNFGICLGPDGQDKYYISTGTSLRFIVEFEKPIVSNFESLRLVFEGKSFPLKISTLQKFITDKIELNYLEEGIQRYPLPIEVYLNDNLIGKYNLHSIIIDTTVPSAPKLKIRRCKCNSFTLDWTPVSNNVKEYLVQRLINKNWITIISVKNPPVIINRVPEGRWRVVAIDCAKNRAVSNEIEISHICQSLYPKFDSDITLEAFDEDSFTIGWSIKNPANIPVTYEIQKLENNIWKSISKIQQLSARTNICIEESPFEGNFRVVMYYCGRMREVKNFTPSVINIIEEGFGESCEKAYNDALLKIGEHLAQLIGKIRIEGEYIRNKRFIKMFIKTYITPFNNRRELGCHRYDNKIYHAKLKVSVRTEDLLQLKNRINWDL